MSRTTPSRRTLSLAAAGAVVASALLTVSASADVVTPVDTTSLNGSRTLTVSSLAGTPLQNAGLTLVPGQPDPFVVNVTDLNYDHVGYQVKVQLSDLYGHDTNGYSFDKSIPSSAVDLDYATNPLLLASIKNLVQPAIALSGTLTGTVSSTDLALLPLGVGSDLSTVSTNGTSVTGVEQSVQDIANDVADGTLSTLPLKVATGASGPFTHPAQLSASGAPAVDTSVTSQLTALQGTPPATPDLAGLLAAVGGAGPKAISTLVSSGLVSQDQVLSAISQATGISLTLLQKIGASTLLSNVQGTVSLPSLLGQSGSYTAVPTLTVTVPSTNVPAGSYRGELTVTLADTP